MATELTKKSTNVRLLQFAFRLLERISPALAGRAAFRVFATPGRARRSEWTHRPDHSAWLRWNGWHVATHVWEAHGPTVLLAHGWHGRASDLSALAEPLRGRGYRVVAFDFPAHGASTGRRTTLPEMVDALEAVARTQPSLHAVVAHSFGGMVTTLALSRGLACERVVLVASPGDMEPYFARLEQGLAMGKRGREAFRERLRSVLRAAGFSGLDVTPTAQALQQPVLVIHDGEDNQVPVSASWRLARAWPHSIRVETKGLGHRRLLRDPAVIDQVTRFLAPVAIEASPRPEPPIRLAAGSSRG